MAAETVKKILICDDEEGIREALKLILGDDYPVILADSGTQCLDFLKHDPTIALALLDIKMPKRNGMDTLKEIKRQFPKVKIIMVTGYRSVETASECTRLGAVGYIVKPFDTQDILDDVARVLGKT